MIDIRDCSTSDIMEEGERLPKAIRRAPLISSERIIWNQETAKSIDQLLISCRKLFHKKLEDGREEERLQVMETADCVSIVVII